MAEVFQRGEDVSWPFLVRDDAGNIIDLAGGALTLSIWYRGKSRLTLAEGSGLTILDESPAIGDPQGPHGTASLTAAQTAALPAGKIAQVQSRFVDAAGRITLSPLIYLDDAIGSTSHEILFGGTQGPAGAPGANGQPGPPGEPGPKRLGQSVRVAWLGDSRTAANTNENPLRVRADGMAFWTEFYTNGLAECSDPYLNFGISGEDSEEILARAPLAAASDADVVVVLASVNDATGMASADNVQAIIELLLAADKTVIAIPELPRIAGWSPQRISQHLAVRERCQDLAGSLNDFFVADPWVDLADPTTGGVKSGIYYDVFVHMTKLGNSYVGRAVATILNKIAVPNSILPAVNVGGYRPVDNEKGELPSNVLLIGTGGALSGATGTAPDGWALTKTANLTAVGSSVTSGGKPWQQVVVSGTATDANQTVILSQNIPLGKLSIGDTIRAVCEVEVDAGAANVHGPSLEIASVGGATSYVSTNYDTVASVSLSAPNIAHAGVMRTPPITIKSGITSLQARVVVKGETGGASALTFRVRALGTRKTAVSSTPTDIDPAAYTTRMSVAPTSDRQALYNALIASLKSAGVWNRLDALYILAAHDAQAARLNLRWDRYNLTANGGLTFTADRGYQGNASTGYLGTGFNPATASEMFALNASHMGVYVLSTDATSSISAIGNTNARIGQSAANFGSRANDATTYSAANAVMPTHLGWSRSGSTYTRFRAGVSLGDIGVAATAMTSADFDIGRVATTYVSNQIAAAHWGGDMTATQWTALYTALRAYMVGVGVPNV